MIEEIIPKPNKTILSGTFMNMKSIMETDKAQTDWLLQRSFCNNSKESVGYFTFTHSEKLKRRNNI